jgi:myo-inositol-1(or 4)-monophosphatase
MSSAPTAVQADWLEVCRRVVRGLDAMLIEHPTTRERAVERGQGKGGDQSLVIDLAAEEVIFGELDELYREGYRFRAVSEERGEVDYGSEDVRVVIDPIDGSMNAKRGLHQYAVSVAVADGSTMADVEFAYVYDFGPGEEWWARRGQGAHLNEARLGEGPPERRMPDGKLELLAVESDPRWLAARAHELVAVANRVRALGSIAVSLCQVACTRVDGMVTLWRCRAVDAAAAQLIVRESGGLISFTAYEDPLAAPLDVRPHSPVIAARTPDSLALLRQVPIPD